MSVIVTLTFEGDPAQMEAQAAAETDRIRGIVEQAKQHELIAHRFYGSEGRILVVDEWPDEQSFQAFFSAAAGDIQPMMDAVGVTSEPEVTFWRTLDTGDEVGWN